MKTAVAHASQTLLLGLLVLLLGVSCSKRAAAGPKKVAIIVSTLNNPWFVVLAETAAKRARALGHEAHIFDSQNNTSQEADHFENAVVSGYDAILLNPTDSDGSIVNVRKAQAAGIPVFCMDREINAAGVATSQILSDNYSGCVALGVRFVQDEKQQGEYAELLGIVGDNNTWNRSKGFHSVVDRFPGLKMVAQQSADFDRNKAMEVMESVLQAHPTIKAVFCGNDAMALGAYQALVAANKAKEVGVYGFDGADDALQGIRAGTIRATGLQSPQLMATTAADFADAYFKGRRNFAQRVPVAVELVNAANIGDYLAH